MRGHRRKKKKEEGGKEDEADLNVLQGGVNDLVVVRETVELESLQVQPDMVTHLWERGQHHGTSHQTKTKAGGSPGHCVCRHGSAGHVLESVEECVCVGEVGHPITEDCK